MRNLRGQVGELRKNKYDVAIDFQGLIKSAVVAKLSGCKKAMGICRPSAPRTGQPHFSHRHGKDSGANARHQKKSIADREQRLDLAKSNERWSFRSTFLSGDVDEAESMIERVGPRFAILNPAGGWVTKLWDARKFGQLADRLWNEFRLPSVIVSGPNEDASFTGRV